MMRSRLHHFLRQEQGVAMVVVVVLFAMLTVLSVTLLATIQSEASRSSHAVVRDAAFQAAEAGIDDYTSKLVDDPLYYAHYVAEGEATRQSGGNSPVSAGASDPTAWSYGLGWTYPNGEDTWRALSNGYEYSLQVFPPCQAVSLPECPVVTTAVRVVAVGRRQQTTTDERKVEVLIRPSSAADYQRLVNGNVSWGTGATTYGKIYSAGNIDHDGTAQGNIYAEGQITGSVTMANGAQRYDVDSTPEDIRDVLENPINYSSFITSLVDIQRAAQVGGLYLDDPTKDAWRLTFQSAGTVQVQSCTEVFGDPVYDRQPNCTTVSGSPFAVPTNGAIYSAQTVIVSGQVHGRVTVASNDDIVIAGDIAPVTPGDDVLGLNAQDDVIAADWSPVDLTWQAAVIAQNGTWWGAGSTSEHNTMTFTGAAITQDGGSWSGMFETRNYYYDDNLLYLPPPWFPTVGDAYTVVLFREVAPP